MLLYSVDLLLYDRWAQLTKQVFFCWSFHLLEVVSLSFSVTLSVCVKSGVGIRQSHGFAPLMLLLQEVRYG